MATPTTKTTAPAAATAPVTAPATPVQAATPPRPVRVAAHAGMVAAQAKLATGTATPTVPRGCPATVYLTAQGLALGTGGAGGMAAQLARVACNVAQANGGKPPVAGHAINAAALAAALVGAGINPGYLTGSYVAGSAKHAKAHTNKQRVAVLAYSAPA